jgi:hypothetical protein
VLKARLLKISTSAYLINIIIYYPLIKLSNDKLRHRRRRTYPFVRGDRMVGNLV